jgi:ABC-type transport system involved in cytochrome c biogenesis permease subunit
MSGGILTALDLAITASRTIGAALAVAAAALYLRHLGASSPLEERRFRRGLLWAAVLFVSLAIAARGAALRTVPLLSPFEALTFYGWLVLVLFLALVPPPSRAAMGTILVPLGAACTAVGALGTLSPQAATADPLLTHPLFVAHVLAEFLAYSTLSVACCAGILYLLLHDRIAHKKFGPLLGRLPSLEDLDRLALHAVVLGVALLTVGIATGVAWARVEWGVAFLWGPKELWSAFTWLFYAAYLATRGGAGWRGVRAAWLSTLGFLANTAAFLGTSWLLAGRRLF